MAFTITTCYVPNKVAVADAPSPGQAQRTIVVRICATPSTNAALMAESPFTITTKDSLNNIVNVTSAIGSVGASTCVSQIAWISPTIPPGTYTVEVTGAITPLVTSTVVVTPTVDIAVVTPTITNPTCDPDSGVLSFVIGGPIPNGYGLRAGNSSGPVVASGGIPGSPLVFTGLPAGNYYLQLTYFSSCGLVNIFNTFAHTYTLVASNISITADITITPEDCLTGNGSILATPTNGTGPYTYLYTDDKTVTSPTNPQTNLSAGTFTLTITDANGCTGDFTIIVPNNPGACGGCFSLTDCFPSPQGTPTYYANGPLLQGLDGYIINGVVLTGQFIDPTKCWLVTEIIGANLVCGTSFPLETFDTFYSECDPCKAIPEEPTIIPEQSHNTPVKPFFQIAESECDIQAIKQFAGGVSSLIKKVRYGITDCCKEFEIEQLWMSKQLSDLSTLTVPGYTCRSTPVSNCGWLPIQTCDICPNTTGGITILAVAGEDILRGKLVMLSNDGKLYLNDPTDSNTYQRCVGFTTMDVLKNNTVRVLIMGLFTNVNWSLINGNIYYATSLGNITSTIPVNPPLAISQMIGTATSSTTLLVDIKQPNIL